MDRESIKYDQNAVYVGTGYPDHSYTYDKEYADLRQKYLDGELNRWDFLDAVGARSTERNLGSYHFSNLCMLEYKANQKWLEAQNAK